MEKYFLFTSLNYFPEKVAEVALKLYDAKIHLFYLEGREKSSVAEIFLKEEFINPFKLLEIGKWFL